MKEKKLNFEFKYYSDKGFYGGRIEGHGVQQLFATAVEDIMLLYFNTYQNSIIKVERAVMIHEEIRVPDFFDRFPDGRVKGAHFAQR